MINEAIIFAAGMGTRMLPLTLDRPKPMLEVLGKPLLGHALERVQAAGIGNIVVNAHHCPEVIEAYLPPQIKLSKEADLLETGGGVKKALRDGLLGGGAPFLAVNADILCTDGAASAIGRLNARWNELADKVDVLLLLVEKDKAWGHDSPKGDYALAVDGQLTRLSNPAAPYVYAGLQITRPSLYAAPDLGEKFSNLEIFDRAQKAGRLYGLVHDGKWFHFSTPASLALFNQQTAPAP